MGLYEGIKDVAKVVQQADNIELYTKLLDLCAQALELQEENMELRKQINDILKEKNIDAHIVRHPQPYITLDNDESTIPYCATCWEREKKLYQMVKTMIYSTPNYTCPVCNTKCRYEVR